MAIKGLCCPVIGKYNNSDGNVTYSTPTVIAKAVESTISIESGDDNPFYADNGIAENDKGTFQGGELTWKTSDLDQETSALILGNSTYTDTLTIDSSPVEVIVQVFDDNSSAPYLGAGIIETHQINDVNKYRAIFLNKVYFNVPEDSATTQGETIEWQTPEITGTILRSDAVDDNGNHPWKEDAWFEDMETAVYWLTYKCGGPSTITTTQTTSQQSEVVTEG